MDEQPSFLTPPAMTSTPHQIRGECQRSMSIDSIPSMASFDMQPYPRFGYKSSVGMGPGSTPTLSVWVQMCYQFRVLSTRGQVFLPSIHHSYQLGPGGSGRPIGSRVPKTPHRSGPEVLMPLHP